MERVQLVCPAAEIADIVPSGREHTIFGIQIIINEIGAFGISPLRGCRRSAAAGIHIGPEGSDDGGAETGVDRTRGETAQGIFESDISVCIDEQVFNSLSVEVQTIRAEDRGDIDAGRGTVVIPRKNAFTEVAGVFNTFRRTESVDEKIRALLKIGLTNRRHIGLGQIQGGERSIAR